MRHAARVDATQAAIVKALRAGGAYVYQIKLPTDLLVGYAGKTVVCECKSLIGKRNPKAAKYTQLQSDFLRDWTGGPVATLTDAEGARNLLRTMECTSAP